MSALTRAVSDRWTAWRAVLAGPWQRWIAAPFAVMTAFQAIRDEVLPADLKEKLRLLKWLPDWPWYVWALIAFGVFSLALLEGSYQFARKVKDTNKPQSSQDERFNVLRQRVLHTVISNDLPVELHALREFLIEQRLTRKPGFRDFFTKWLEGIAVVTGMRAVNVFTHEQLEELTKELRALELNNGWRDGLGEALEAGAKLRKERISNEAELVEWQTRMNNWITATGDYIASHVSAADRHLFMNPPNAPRAVPGSFPGSYNHGHDRLRSTLEVHLIILRNLMKRRED